MALADQPLVFSSVISMLSLYGDLVGGSGPVRWVDDVIPVFESRLRVHCEKKASGYINSSLKKSPNLLGYMPDNELGFYHARFN